MPVLVYCEMKFISDLFLYSAHDIISSILEKFVTHFLLSNEVIQPLILVY